MIDRHLTPKLTALAEKFQVITLTGPRQSGKTTLVRSVFPSLPYASLEEPDTRQLALNDPRGFLSNYPNGAILDEVQHTPDLFSYIQTIVDQNRNTRYILTGSSNFLLLEKVSQTLAGRTAILHLLPLSNAELSAAGISFDDYETAIFYGHYPRIFDREIAPGDFYPANIQTYVERDVRLIKNIEDVNAFIQFVQLCAGRTGQLLNLSSLANDAGISPNTARSWISILEASYIVYRLQPFHKNFSKRIIKSPKLYFHDTGIVCSLLGLTEPDQVRHHYLKGALFENLVINELIKYDFNQGEHRYPHFWRDNHGHEIDCILQEGPEIVPIEIKAGRTRSTRHFDQLVYWRELAGISETRGSVVYGGDESVQTSSGNLVSWKQMERIRKS